MMMMFLLSSPAYPVGVHYAGGLWPRDHGFIADPLVIIHSTTMFYTTISSRTWCFPEIAGCLGHFSASEIASDAPPIASAAELQSHRQILALGLTERFSKLIKIGCVFQNGGCSEMGFHSRSEQVSMFAPG